jgi:hypothetical protein
VPRDPRALRNPESSGGYLRSQADRHFRAPSIVRQGQYLAAAFPAGKDRPPLARSADTARRIAASDAALAAPCAARANRSAVPHAPLTRAASSYSGDRGIARCRARLIDAFTRSTSEAPTR